ncbi:hypothetical protein BH10CYA1_BH10CYA1_04220 [soil metagenome]
MKNNSDTEPTSLDLTVNKFEEILGKGDKETLRIFLAGTTESEREKFATSAIRWYKKAVKGEFKESKPGHFSWVWPLGKSVADTCALAVVATANAEQLSKIEWSVIPEDDEDLDWLAGMKPGALENFGDVLIVNKVFRFEYIRRLMSRNLCRKPDNDRYIVGLIGAGNGFIVNKTERISLHDWLLANPDVLEEDIWRIFEVEGDQENSLAALDKYSNVKPWSTTLVTLVLEGHLPKQRLLEASLDALNCGFNQFKSGWFSRFHEALQPSPEERAGLTERYALLLGNLTPPTVAFALKALEHIDKKQPLPEEVLLTYLTPALVSGTKGTVAAALGLLERAIKRNNAFATSACLMAADALQHDSPDVQNKTMGLLEKWGNLNDEALKGKVAGYVDSAAPSVRARIQPWANTSLQQSEQPRVAQARYIMGIPSATGWPLSCAPPVEPLQSVELIISKAGYCLEHPDQVDEIERVIDAIARLRVAPDDDFKALSAPLKKRISKLLPAQWSTQSVGSQSLQFLFADFLRSWLDVSLTISSSPPRTSKFHPALHLMALRMVSIYDRLKAGIFLPLLSAPTHRGGWIEPAQFFKRVNVWLEATTKPDQYDLILALVRIPKSDWGTVLKSPLLKDLKLQTAHRYLIGEAALNDCELSVDMLASYFQKPPENRVGPEFVKGSVFDTCDDGALLRWIVICCPTLREELFKAGIRRAAPAVDYWYAADRVLKAYFELLTGPGAPLENNALTLLSIGLMLSDPECCGLARDATISAIEERRLNLAQVANVISSYLHSERGMPKRLAKSLSEIARVSEVHADAVLQIIELSMRGDSSKSKDLCSLLELLQELLASQERTLNDVEARKYLQSIAGGGKTGQLVKSLLSQID